LPGCLGIAAGLNDLTAGLAVSLSKAPKECGPDKNLTFRNEGDRRLYSVSRYRIGLPPVTAMVAPET